MSRVVGIEAAREKRLKADAAFMRYARDVWRYLGGQTELTNPILLECWECWECWESGASAHEAADELRAWYDCD